MQLFLLVGGIKFPADIHLREIFGRRVVAPSSAPKDFLRDDIWEPWVHKSPYKTLIPYWKGKNVHTLAPSWKYWNGEDLELFDFRVTRDECQLYSYHLQGMEAERQLAQEGLDSKQIKTLEISISRWHPRYDQVLQGHSFQNLYAAVRLTSRLLHQFILSRQDSPRIQAMKNCWVAYERCEYELGGLQNDLASIRFLRGNMSLGRQFANHMKKLDDAYQQHMIKYLLRGSEAKALRRKIKTDIGGSFTKVGFADARFQALAEADMVTATTDDYDRRLHSIIDEIPLLWPFFSVYDRTSHIYKLTKLLPSICLKYFDLVSKDKIGGFRGGFRPDNQIHVTLQTAFVGIRMSAAKINVLWLEIMDLNQEMYEMAVFRITSTDKVPLPTASDLIRKSRDFTIKVYGKDMKRRLHRVKRFQELNKRP